uniref:Uncharacterized protein n=1 Tax=Physcomitrium patens TaxID=3218 RepID=A9T6K6_PHYPA|nr:hypothetical protein PHYPA_022172 [Physcomitrium patens]
MSTSKSKFEMRALIIIVPFGAAFLLGILCIFRHKFFLWRLSKNDPESTTAEPKIDAANANKVNLYQAPSNPESGISGIESESDSALIAQSNKAGRKSLCV